MSPRIPAILVPFAFALACSTPPPPVEPPPPPPPKKVEAPPPPPKCEALEEKCKAEGGTRARIARSSFVFAPVAGWIYAQGEGATVAQDGGDSGAAIVIAVYEADAKDAKKELAARDAAFEQLAKQIALTPPKGKVRWQLPTCQCKGSSCTGSGGELCKAMKPASELKSSVWQLDGGVRAGKKGPLLVVHAALPDNKALLGLGFVADDDKSGADAGILKAIESIGPGATSAPETSK
jgi:hypothetical protein